MLVPLCPVSGEKDCDHSAASFVYQGQQFVRYLLGMWWDPEMLFFICICQHKVQPISSDTLLNSKAGEPVIALPRICLVALD